MIIKESFSLIFTGERVELREIAKPRNKPLYVDFLHGKAAHRRKYGGGRGQLIARAVGVKKGVTLTVLDATAGLGQDAFVLACLGCKMTLLERSPIIAALLKDGLKRADMAMELIVTDAISYMKKLSNNKKPDVVYLDPMYPTRTKSALVKKEMRILRQIVGEDPDAAELLQIALQTARKRVVVKRPRLAPQIPGHKPNVVFKGKTSRFDVYLKF
jgi:16S rRNA (guanine1516-N2)-methyltransferase